MQLITNSAKDAITSRLRLRGQERVEQTSLGPAETQVITLGRAHARQGSVLLQPLQFFPHFDLAVPWVFPE